VGNFCGDAKQLLVSLSTMIAFSRERQRHCRVDVGAYGTLVSDSGEECLFTLGVRVVAGSNPATPTSPKSLVSDIHEKGPPLRMLCLVI
jgi:hypothetical protein